jgi:putative phosphoribosyl transferase
MLLQVSPVIHLMLCMYLRRSYMRLPFSNRVEAGRLLAAELKQYRDRPGVIVIGLPRGGVSTAFEVARALRAPLDVMPVRKLGTPGQKELAMGAIAPGGVRVLDERIIKELDIRQETIERITAAEKLTLNQRERSYRAGRPPRDLRDRTVILVDDGVATGSTMHAALKAVKQHRPTRVVAAVPVASDAAWGVLAGEADEVACLAIPEPFYAVGLWYEDFPQVSDEEVRRLLAQSAQQKVA